MFDIFKLFPKLCFSIDGTSGGGNGDSTEQPDETDQTNTEDAGGDSDTTTPTDVELEGGVKVPQSVLDKWAKETYKDRFDAYDNREKWQAENTRKAQEYAQAQRDAEAYRRLMADPQRRQTESNPKEAKRREYVEKKSKAFPEVDPRFFESQFDDMWELSGQRANESISPILEQQGQTFEREFLKAHPDVIKGSAEYGKIAELMGAGVDAEEAYQFVFRASLEQKRIEEAIKRKEEDAKRKLKQTRQASTQGSTERKGTRSEKIWQAIRAAGVEE